MVNTNGSCNGNGNEKDVQMGECFVCGKGWSLPADKYAWHERKIKEDRNWRMPTRCPSCKEKRQTEESTLAGLPHVPVTYQTGKENVTVTRMVPAVPEPPKLPRKTEALLSQGASNQERSGVVLKPSALVELRSIHFPIHATQVAKILGTTSGTDLKWTQGRGLKYENRTSKRVWFRGAKVAEWLEERECDFRWEVESGSNVPALSQPVSIVTASEPATVAQAKLSDADLLWLTFNLHIAENPSNVLRARLDAEVRSRVGTAQPSREVLKWMLGSAA